ncbi:MAG: ABC transporter substrate-binding protein [Reyranella sp.]|nr:ABC transporter substrate-binding protein [Reyranella sp.]
MIVLRPSAEIDWDHFGPALRTLGYMPGQNLVLEYRFAGGDIGRIPALAREIAQSKPDIVIAVGAAATRAMRAASVDIPLVMFGNFDPVAAGLATSLARPGRDITGVMISSEGTLAAKKMELLREAVPNLRRLGVLVPHDPNVARQIDEVRVAAKTLSLEMTVAEGAPDLYANAFAALADARVEALLVAAHTFFVRDRAAIIRLAERARLPAIYEWPDQVRDGGLMAYGPNLDRLWQRIAVYVDRILKGTPAGSLPIELPTAVELAINVRTARAIGLALPPTLLARADTIYE